MEEQLWVLPTGLSEQEMGDVIVLIKTVTHQRKDDGDNQSPHRVKRCLTIRTLCFNIMNVGRRG
jgi:hypothetical protein